MTYYADCRRARRNDWKSMRPLPIQSQTKVLGRENDCRHSHHPWQWQPLQYHATQPLKDDRNFVRERVRLYIGCKRFSKQWKIGHNQFNCLFHSLSRSRKCISSWYEHPVSDGQTKDKVNCSTSRSNRRDQLLWRTWSTVVLHLLIFLYFEKKMLKPLTFDSTQPSAFTLLLMKLKHMPVFFSDKRKEIVCVSICCLTLSHDLTASWNSVCLARSVRAATL